MSDKSSTDQKMPLPSKEVRERLLNPDFLNPSSLPDTSEDGHAPLDQAANRDLQNNERAENVPSNKNISEERIEPQVDHALSWSLEREKFKDR
jgi:hypothetical protein